MENVEDVPRRKFDIIVFGASGFTGQYVVEELARTVDAENGVTWAVAGRSMKKLQNVLATASKETGKDLSDLPTIIADVSNEKSLEEMCSQAKVILNCVGPYRFYGTPVVKACIEQKCHHIDICGEPEWLEKVQLLYDGKAKESGIYVLEACGFDSIPVEMGLLFMKQQFSGDLNAIENYISVNFGPEGGHFNHGTWDSAVHSVANRGELKNIRSQLYPNPLPRNKHRMIQRSPVFHSKDVGKWCVPFLGADKAIVYRSNRHNFEQKKERTVQFQPYMCLQSFFHLIVMIMVGMILTIFTRFSLGIRLLTKYPRIMSFGLFSDVGPNRKQMEGTSFTMTFIGQGFGTKITDLEKDHEDLPDKKIVTEVVGPEPAYVATPICMVQAAYVLLKEKDKLPKGGGVYTPGAAFADTKLLARLQQHNLKFSVLEK